MHPLRHPDAFMPVRLPGPDLRHLEIRGVLSDGDRTVIIAFDLTQAVIAATLSAWPASAPAAPAASSAPSYPDARRSAELAAPHARGRAGHRTGGRAAPGRVRAWLRFGVRRMSRSEERPARRWLWDGGRWAHPRVRATPPATSPRHRPKPRHTDAPPYHSRPRTYRRW
jgi:hypothetical protein